MTNQGIHLDYTIIDESQQTIPSRKKFSKDQLDVILSYQQQINDKQLSKTRLQKTLELDHQLKISPATLTKILTNQY